MKKRKIVHNDWRWSVSQWILKLLYGRSYHFISPWCSAGIAGMCIFTYNGKFVLAKRRGNIENVGLRSFIGGYTELIKDEDPLDGMIREVWEESGLRLARDRFDALQPLCHRTRFKKYMIELEDECHIALFWHYELSAEERAAIKETEEAHDYQDFTYDEVVEMYHANQFAGRENLEVINRIKELKLVS